MAVIVLTVNGSDYRTGHPTSVRGISGDLCLDRATYEPVVMTGPELLEARRPNIRLSGVRLRPQRCHGQNSRRMPS